MCSVRIAKKRGTIRLPRPLAVRWALRSLHQAERNLSFTAPPPRWLLSKAVGMSALGPSAPETERAKLDAYQDQWTTDTIVQCAVGARGPPAYLLGAVEGAQPEALPLLRVPDLGGELRMGSGRVS